MSARKRYVIGVLDYTTPRYVVSPLLGPLTADLDRATIFTKIKSARNVARFAAKHTHHRAVTYEVSTVLKAPLDVFMP